MKAIFWQGDILKEAIGGNVAAIVFFFLFSLIMILPERILFREVSFAETKNVYLKEGAAAISITFCVLNLLDFTSISILISTIVNMEYI